LTSHSPALKGALSTASWTGTVPTLLLKCAGLTGEQLAQVAVPPSNLSLLGIVRHMADVERAWFRIRFRGEALPRLYDYEDAAFEHADPARAETDFAAFTEECDLARKAVAQASLDDAATAQVTVTADQDSVRAAHVTAAIIKRCPDRARGALALHRQITRSLTAVRAGG
jgi:hypothetical protein